MEAINELGVVITSSPFLIPSKYSAKVSASVPLLRATVYLDLVNLEILFSNFPISIPPTHSPVDKVLSIISNIFFL